MEQVLNNFDFLRKLSQSNCREFRKLINTASDSELKALSACLSLSKVVTFKKSPNALKFKKCANLKAFRKFAASKGKVFLPIITCVLSKLIQDLFYCIYDNV